MFREPVALGHVQRDMTFSFFSQITNSLEVQQATLEVMCSVTCDIACDVTIRAHVFWGGSTQGAFLKCSPPCFWRQLLTERGALAWTLARLAMQ